MRRFLLVAVLALSAGRAWAQDTTQGDSGPKYPTADDAVESADEVPHIHASSPWYLPREVSLLTTVGRTVTPTLRIGWEAAFIQERADALLFVLNGGAGWALSTDNTPDSDGNPGFTWFRLATVQAGLGYRQVFSDDWAFGFKLTVGPAWLAARSTGLPDDSQVIGMVEGRFEIGHYFGTVQVGLTGGIQTVVDHPVRHYASYGAGGVAVGVFANWR